MKSSHLLATSVLVALALPGLAFAAKAVPDIAPPQKRQASVETAERLAKRPPPAPLGADLPSPFNPPDFNKRDPAPDAPPSAGGSAPAANAPADPGTPPPPPSNRQILETLAARIPSTGTIKLGARPLLTMAGGKRLEIGTKFVVSYDNQDYELELVAIDSTTFTLRYRGEEYTRPIKSVR